MNLGISITSLNPSSCGTPEAPCGIKSVGGSSNNKAMIGGKGEILDFSAVQRSLRGVAGEAAQTSRHRCSLMPSLVLIHLFIHFNGNLNIHALISCEREGCFANNNQQSPIRRCVCTAPPRPPIPLTLPTWRVRAREKKRTKSLELRQVRLTALPREKPPSVES